MNHPHHIHPIETMTAKVSQNHDETDTDLEAATDEETNLTEKNVWQTKNVSRFNRLATCTRSFSTCGLGCLSYAFPFILFILLVINLFILSGVQEIKNHAIFVTPITTMNNNGMIQAQIPPSTSTLPSLPITTADTSETFLASPVFETCSCTQVQDELSTLITTLRRLAPQDRPLDGQDELHEFMRPIERGGSSRHEYPNGHKKGIPFSYSQLNQDTRLFNTYPHTFQQRTGAYLEIGGRNGYYLSNTYMYERFLDWSGMLVEINPRWEDLGELSRPGSIWLNGAISSVNGTVEVGYSDGWNVMFNGVTPHGDKPRPDVQEQQTAQNWMTTRAHVPTYSLGQLLPKYGLNRIDLFSLDVAGAEYLVLETVDWSVTQFHFLLIQVNSHMDECAKLLNSHGYQYVDTWDQVQLWTLSDYLWSPQTCTQEHCQGLQQRLKYFKAKKQKYLSSTMKYPPPHLTLAS